MKRSPLYQQLAMTFNALLNCQRQAEQTGTPHGWTSKHHATIDDLAKEYLPSGSGFDSGTKFDFDRSKEERLVFSTAYHHM